MKTELARAVDVVMERAKKIYILMIKVNNMFSFFSSRCFLKDCGLAETVLQKKSWPNHIKNEQHKSSKKAYDPKILLQIPLKPAAFASTVLCNIVLRLDCPCIQASMFAEECMSSKHKIEVFFGYVLLLVVIVTGKITMVNSYGKIISPVVNYT